MAQTSQSKPHSGLGLKVKIIKTFQVVPSPLGIGRRDPPRWRVGGVWPFHRLDLSEAPGSYQAPAPLREVERLR